MTKNRYGLMILLLATALVIAYGSPRPKYQSPDYLSKLTIPAGINSWQSRDVSNFFKAGDKRYFFINKVFARQYMNDMHESLLWLILDAGNFHHPKVCYSSSGYTVKPLDDTIIVAGKHAFKAHVLYMQKGADSVLLIYWMCIDKKPVSWVQQKFIQFFYSMANKQKIGFMGRLEVPVPTGDLENALSLAKHFMRQIGPAIPDDQADYLFGKK